MGSGQLVLCCLIGLWSATDRGWLHIMLCLSRHACSAEILYMCIPIQMRLSKLTQQSTAKQVATQAHARFKV